MIPATFPRNLRSIPLPGTSLSAVSSMNFMCLMFSSLFLVSSGSAGERLPSRLMHLSMNAAISVEILKLFTGVANTIASASSTLS
ncbi:Uncharacterised protein [uncultured archaeon]|nr:Uncharacterised protein [uncultured archaeon]